MLCFLSPHPGLPAVALRAYAETSRLPGKSQLAVFRDS